MPSLAAAETAGRQPLHRQRCQQRLPRHSLPNTRASPTNVSIMLAQSYKTDCADHTHSKLHLVAYVFGLPDQHERVVSSRFENKSTNLFRLYLTLSFIVPPTSKLNCSRMMNVRTSLLDDCDSTSTYCSSDVNSGDPVIGVGASLHVCACRRTDGYVRSLLRCF